MKMKYLLFLLVVVLYQCTSPKYITKRQSEIVNLDLDHSITNYIPIADTDLNSSKVLDSTYMLIVGKKFVKLDKYIKWLELSGKLSSDIYLSKTLLLISKREYVTAFQSLGKVNDSDYSLLKHLLSIDLNYEIAQQNGTFNYNKFLKSYQNLIDTYPDDDSLKKIVAIRLRYLRYNY